MNLHRRTLVLTAGAAALAACAPDAKSSSPSEAAFADSPYRKISEEAWRKRLSPEAFRVLRKEATERPFTSPLNKEKRKGSYHCAGCDLELFKSHWKFESGTGWPSFFRVIEAHIGTKPDLLLLQPRTEYHCARCLGHQGHVFEDGPPPTRLRYCNNGVALTFKPAG